MKVVRLAPDQAEGAAKLLSRALCEDASSVYHFPDDQTRPRKLEWYHGWLLRIASRGGVVDAVSPDLAGVAIWMPPGEERITLRKKFAAGLASAPLAIGPGAIARVLGSMSALEKVHLRTLPAQHWYLVVIGVDPSHQGRGVGSALMKHALQRADEGGFPSYLETTSKASRKTFQQFGFEVVGEAAGARGLPTWSMVRKPAVPEPSIA